MLSFVICNCPSTHECASTWFTRDPTRPSIKQFTARGNTMQNTAKTMIAPQYYAAPGWIPRATAVQCFGRNPAADPERPAGARYSHDNEVNTVRSPKRHRWQLSGVLVIGSSNATTTVSPSQSIATRTTDTKSNAKYPMIYPKVFARIPGPKTVQSPLVNRATCVPMAKGRINDLTPFRCASVSRKSGL
jgi:hypothetical protein